MKSIYPPIYKVIRDLISSSSTRMCVSGRSIGGGGYQDGGKGLNLGIFEGKADRMH